MKRNHSYYGIAPMALGRGRILLDPAATDPKGDLGDLKTSIKDIGEGVKKLGDNFKTTDEIIKGLQTDNEKLNTEVKNLRRQLVTASFAHREIRQRGKVTARCAMYLAAATLIGGVGNARSVKPEVLGWARKHVEAEVIAAESQDPFHGTLARYLNKVKSTAIDSGIIVKDALTTSEIPLPTAYSAEIVELVEEFGTFRRYAESFPMGEATVNLPKLTTDPTFGFIDTSEAIPEKSPAIENVEFSAKKAGGIVRIPAELEMDSIVALGQFVARYMARQMAAWEDQVGWKADGSATYKTLEGVVKRVVSNNKTVQLGNGLTASADITLAGLRAQRAKITNEGVLSMSAYYINHTLESVLAALTDDKNQKVYSYQGANGATLDGFPVRWINKLPVNSTDAIASTVVSVFGDMSYWYLGLRGAMRLDTDRSVFFANDQIGVRALERFTVNEMATEHMSGLLTAAN